MTDRARNVAFVVCLGLLALGVLVLVGIETRAKWDSFTPDLIVGVVGAGSIAGLIAWLQRVAEDRRAHADDVSAAYRAVFEAVPDIRGIDYKPGATDAVRPIRVFTTRLAILSEITADDEPWIEQWFEAERQLMLQRARQVGEAMKVLEEDDVDHTIEDVLAATAPLNEWTAEFTNNLRLWRSGRASQEQIKRQTLLIETPLKAAGIWQSNPLPWRQDFGPREV